MILSCSPPGLSKPLIGAAATTKRYCFLLPPPRRLDPPGLYYAERHHVSRLRRGQLVAPGDRGRSRGAGGGREVSPAGHGKRPAGRLHGVGCRRRGLEHAPGGPGIEHGRAGALSAPRFLRRGLPARLLLCSGGRRRAATGAIGFCDLDLEQPPSIIPQGFGRIHGA